MFRHFFIGYFRGLGHMAAKATWKLILLALAAAGLLALSGGGA